MDQQAGKIMHSRDDISVEVGCDGNVEDPMVGASVLHDGTYAAPRTLAP